MAQTTETIPPEQQRAATEASEDNDVPAITPDVQLGVLQTVANFLAGLTPQERERFIGELLEECRKVNGGEPCYIGGPQIGAAH